MLDMLPKYSDTLDSPGAFTALTIVFLSIVFVIVAFAGIWFFELRAKRKLEEAAALDRLSRLCDGCGGAGTVNRIVDDENEGKPYKVKCPRCGGRGRLSIGDAPTAPPRP